ncbi:MAG TPA: helix-turn-helix transcriptional regulator [Anaeromyxobacteraceae bacterium]|nr:helix-turn-helix transcriptional regulator [Anaeromyxobacteraceae bacterium]
MPHIDPELLVPAVTRLVDDTHLTPSEHAEVVRIAQGFACKDSAAAANVSPETIRARRKRIYRKLAIAGSGELISALLALALEMVSGKSSVPRPGRPPGSAPATDPSAALG